jgi:hypothetical protein
MGQFRLETPSGSSSSAGYCSGDRLIILAIENATFAGTRQVQRRRLVVFAAEQKAENFSLRRIRASISDDPEFGLYVLQR